MRTTAITFFAAGALAAPSVLKRHHQHHHERRQAVDVEYTTCVETEVVYTTIGADQTAAPAPVPTSSAADAEGSSAPAVYQPAPQAPPSSSVDPVTSLPVAAMEYHDAPTLGSSTAAAAATSEAAPASYAAPASSHAAPASQKAPASSQAAPASYAAPSSVVAAPSPAPASSQAASSSAAAPSSSTSSSASAGSYPFQNIVIFGDNLSDRGNGSSDHNLAGDPETIYGYKTWTDGPIAAEQLADSMKLNIVYDYAYGHSDGGSKFGATIDNVITMSDAGVPSVKDQIANYTKSDFCDKSKMGSYLHFVWGGNNDVIPWEKDPQQHPVPELGPTAAGNTKFATDLANAITTQVKSLADAGADHIFVPNVYNRHVAPVVQRYFSNDTNWVNTYGQIIQNVNFNLRTNIDSLAQSSGKKIVYYDAFSFLMDTYNAAKESGANGINMMRPGQNICDGAYIDPVPGVKSLAYCAQGHGDQFYWMQYLDMTAHVHGLLAQDMQNAIQAAWGS